MDTLENKPLDPAPAPDFAALKAECDHLRRLVTSALVLMIIVSGTINLYLLRQVKYARVDLASLTQMRNEYEKVRPVMEQFVQRAQEFGRTHPDFMPILTKYNLRPGATAPAGVAPGTSAPAPAAIPKR